MSLNGQFLLLSWLSETLNTWPLPSRFSEHHIVFPLFHLSCPPAPRPPPPPSPAFYLPSSTSFFLVIKCLRDFVLSPRFSSHTTLYAKITMTHFSDHLCHATDPQFSISFLQNLHTVFLQFPHKCLKGNHNLTCPRLRLWSSSHPQTCPLDCSVSQWMSAPLTLKFFKMVLTSFPLFPFLLLSPTIISWTIAKVY